jgi:hypothetical protein
VPYMRASTMHMHPTPLPVSGFLAGKENTPEGGVYFVLYVFVLYFVLYLYFLAPATREHCGGRKRDGASCLGRTLCTWLCSMSNSIIYHVSCYILYLSTHIHTT